MRRAAPLLCVLALAACGGHRMRAASDPCAFPPPPRAGASAGAPTAATLVDVSLRKALAAQDVRFDLRLSLGATYDPSRAGVAERPFRKRLAALAAHRWCLAFAGIRTRDGLSGSGVLEQTGTRTPFALILSHRGAYLRVHGRWYGEPRFSTATMFSSEFLAGAIPQAACIRTQSEGCDRVDVRRLLAQGLLAHVFAGRVGRTAGGWTLAGTLDPEGFVRLMGHLGDPASYDPYARNGRAWFSVGRDGRPSVLELRWSLDRLALAEHEGYGALGGAVSRQRVHLRIALSHWGEGGSLGVPAHAAAFDERRAERLFTAISLVLGLYG